MEINKAFEGAIGQESVKRTLSVFIDSYKATNRLPFINLTTQKGGGKTFFARKFREALQRPDGTRPPMLEINGKTIKNARSFFEQVYPLWVEHSAFLFIDEGHNIPKDLQEIFLTALNVDKNPIRNVTTEDGSFTFDFSKLSLCMATTNQEKLCEPLRDRLRDISFEDYSSEELYNIFESNLEEKVSVDSTAKKEIISVFRGNPRDAVVKAQDVQTYAAATNLKVFTKTVWSQFCKAMGVNPMGLSNSEIQIVKTLRDRGAMTLNGLSSVTGYQKQAIQKDYEQILMRKNLLQIDVKRKLTGEGIAFAQTI
jgi:Holliday junction resolvasome RuvABC ATP-dependent DNA helicase subunit